MVGPTAFSRAQEEEKAQASEEEPGVRWQWQSCAGGEGKEQGHTSSVGTERNVLEIQLTETAWDALENL